MRLEDPVSDIIRILLINLGLAQNSEGDWEIFTGLIPETPNESITCFDTAGILQGRIMATGEQISHPGVQIVIRSPIFPNASRKAREIAETLDSQHNISVEVESGRSYFIQNISRTGDIIPIGIAEDDRRRYHFSINAVLTIHQEI